MPIAIDVKKLEVITSSCDFSHQTISDLKNQITKIIEYKKQTQAASGDEHLMLKQVEELKKNIDNFETLNTRLSTSIQELKVLCHEAHHVLSRYADVKSGSALGYSVGESRDAEELQKEDKG